MEEMSFAWNLASDHIQAQVTQKKAYDKKAREVDLHVGECVMVLIPSEIQGKDWELTKPFRSPYHVIQQMLKFVLLNSLRVNQVLWHWIVSANVTKVKEMRHGLGQRRRESSIAGTENWITLDLLERERTLEE